MQITITSDAAFEGLVDALSQYVDNQGEYLESCDDVPAGTLARLQAAESFLRELNGLGDEDETEAERAAEFADEADELERASAFPAEPAPAKRCGSYEDAPATKLVATQCAACAKPLVDAASLQAGLGPECCRKYGVKRLDDDTRQAANVLIYAIAAHQDGPDAVVHLAGLRSLGLDELADRIERRLAPHYTAVMRDEGERFSVRASFDVAQLAGLGSVRGRRWDKDRKVNTYPLERKREVFLALRAAFPGGKGLGPRGEFSL